MVIRFLSWRAASGYVTRERKCRWKGQYDTNIPNAIDTRVFCRKDQAEVRTIRDFPDKRLILFVSQRVTDERKGRSI